MTGPRPHLAVELVPQVALHALGAGRRPLGRHPVRRHHLHVPRRVGDTLDELPVLEEGEELVHLEGRKGKEGGKSVALENALFLEC